MFYSAAGMRGNRLEFEGPLELRGFHVTDLLACGSALVRTACDAGPLFSVLVVPSCGRRHESPHQDPVAFQPDRGVKRTGSEVTP
jgi:hypothetical protein